jgi:hypothetical protein
MAQYSHIFADFDEVSYFLEVIYDSMESVRFYKCWQTFMHFKAPLFFNWCFTTRDFGLFD